MLDIQRNIEIAINNCTHHVSYMLTEADLQCILVNEINKLLPEGWRAHCELTMYHQNEKFRPDIVILRDDKIEVSCDKHKGFENNGESYIIELKYLCKKSIRYAYIENDLSKLNYYPKKIPCTLVAVVPNSSKKVLMRRIHRFLKYLGPNINCYLLLSVPEDKISEIFNLRKYIDYKENNQ